MVWIFPAQSKSSNLENNLPKFKFYRFTYGEDPRNNACIKCKHTPHHPFFLFFIFLKEKHFLQPPPIHPNFFFLCILIYSNSKPNKIFEHLKKKKEKKKKNGKGNEAK